MKASKKHIQETLRSLNTTEIFRLYKSIYGEINRSKLYDFIRYYAPTESIAKSAYAIAYGRKPSYYSYRNWGTHGIYEPLPLQNIVNHLMEWCKDPASPYAKKPMLGHTHLYFCSPEYGHKDYNKWAALPIAGNERFCETAIRYAERYFNA